MLTMTHYLPNCKCIQFAYTNVGLCNFCYTWSNLTNWMYSHCFSYSNFESLPPCSQYIAREAIKIEKDKNLYHIATGETALMYAVNKGLSYWCAFLVIKCGANISAKNIHGETALDLAKSLIKKRSNTDYGDRLARVISFLERCHEDDKNYPIFIERLFCSVGIYRDIVTLILNYTPSALRSWPSWAIIDVSRDY